MDVIENYLNRIPIGEKKRVSDFMLEMDTHVARVEYNTDGIFSASYIRGFWTQQFEQFRELFILDFNIVNWKYILLLTLENANQERTLYKIGSSNDTIDEPENPFQTIKTTIPFNIDTITLKNDIKTLIMEARNMKEDTTKRDYIYYGILDFVTKKDDKKTKTLLKSDYDKWREQIISSCIDTINNAHIALNISFSPNDAYGYAKNLVKNQVRRSKLKKSDNDYKLKKMVANVLKIQNQQFKYPSPMNEYTFIICYLSRVISLVLDLNKKNWYYKWGESKLSASKDEDNMTKNDDESGAVGSSIDGITTLKNSEIDVLLIEVSGPMWKEDYSHFLNDRMKIAKNLKKMMKKILRKKLVMDEAKDLKLYGMQIYRNKIHVYCLSMPILGIYCFVEIIDFAIPTSSSTLSKDFPQYIKYLIKTLKLIAFSAKNLKEYMVENDLYESDETQTSPLSPPYVSPQKGTKRKKSSVSSSSSSSSR